MCSNGEQKMMDIARAPQPTTISIVKLEPINPDDEVKHLINLDLEYFDHSSDILKNLKKEPEDEDGLEDPLCTHEPNIQQFQDDTPIQVKSESTINEETRKDWVIPKCTSQNPNYACRFCQLNFSEKVKYEEHFKIHRVDKPYKCETCDSSFTRRTALVTHKCGQPVRVRPSRLWKFHCAPCGVWFASNSSLMGHKETPHHKYTEQKPYNCGVCGISFVSKSTLNAHERIHSGEKPFKCEICGMCFPWELSLDVHKLNHSGEKPFKCDIENCGMTFSSFSRLTEHKKLSSHQKGSVKCDDCGMYFRGAPNLRKHQVSHTAKKS